MAAWMTNQIEFIINHIASKPDYIDSASLYEEFQDNQEKWAEVEVGIYDEYIRREATLSPKSQKLKCDQEQHHYKENHQDKQIHTLHRVLLQHPWKMHSNIQQQHNMFMMQMHATNPTIQQPHDDTPHQMQYTLTKGTGLEGIHWDWLDEAICNTWKMSLPHDAEFETCFECNQYICPRCART